MSEAPSGLATRIAALLDRRRFAHARDVLGDALEQYPNDPGLLCQAARLDYLENRHDDALSTLNHVLSTDPHGVDARALQFAILLQKGDYAQAERVVLGLLNDLPEHAWLYGCYARLMITTLHLDKAKHLVEAGLRYSPEDSECLTAKTILEMIELQEGAPLPGLHRLLVNDPNALATLALVVARLSNAGRLTEARRVANQLVQAAPDNAHFVEIAEELRIVTHWSMTPLRVLGRFGFVGVAVLWLGALASIIWARHFAPSLVAPIGFVYFSFAVYSWVWPRLLRYIVKRWMT